MRHNERMKATIEYAPIGIVTFNRDLSIVAVNPAFAGMIGVDADEIVGSQFSAFSHPDEVAKTVDMALSSLNEGITHSSMRTRYIHKDGHVVHATLHVATGYDDEGRPDFGVANIEDLTSRLSAAAQIRDQRNEHARIDRLSSLGEMTAGIAHEINQPLTAISTYAQAAARFVDQGEVGAERLKEALTRLREQSHRASSIVERIRALARQRESQTELVDCNDLVRNTVDLIADDIGDSDIEFRTALMPHPPFVLCDPAQLQQVLISLIRNAIESMQRAEFHGGKEIHLKTEATDTNGVCVFVVDSGLGVDESVRDTLFEPFSTNAATGLGMGLATARSVVHSFGGKIEYRNNLSKGATFTITLPEHSGEIGDQKSPNSNNS
jgi:PAS domain S-box-containing protein